MTAAEAIKIAAGRVRFQSFGKRQGLNQYQVNHYDEEQRVWWQGQITSSRDQALRTAWECKVSIALELLGFESVDAHIAAASALYHAYPKDWRQVVRDEVKAAKLAASQEERAA